MLIDAKGFYDYDQRESGNILEDNENEFDEGFWIKYILYAN